MTPLSRIRHSVIKTLEYGCLKSEAAYALVAYQIVFDHYGLFLLLFKGRLYGPYVPYLAKTFCLFVKEVLPVSACSPCRTDRNHVDLGLPATSPKGASVMSWGHINRLSFPSL